MGYVTQSRAAKMGVISFFNPGYNHTRFNPTPGIIPQKKIPQCEQWTKSHIIIFICYMHPSVLTKAML